MIIFHILPAIGSALAPIVAIWLVFSWLPFINADTWQTLPEVVAEAYRSSARAGVLALAILAGPFLALTFVSAYLFFTTRTSAPAVFIFTNWFGSIYATAVVLCVVFSGVDEETPAASLVGETVRDFTSIFSTLLSRSLKPMLSK